MIIGVLIFIVPIFEKMFKNLGGVSCRCRRRSW